MLGRRGQFSKKKIGGGPAHSSSRIRLARAGKRTKLVTAAHARDVAIGLLAKPTAMLGRRAQSWLPRPHAHVVASPLLPMPPAYLAALATTR
jgi:hypothetical protein